jgi:hypothetical protein
MNTLTEPVNLVPTDVLIVITVLTIVIHVLETEKISQLVSVHLVIMKMV